GETEALFRTLKLLVAHGLSILFISHKLHEVLAVSDRVLVLRHGRLAGAVATRDTSRGELAALMVGEAVHMPEPRPSSAGRVLLELRDVTVEPRQGGIRLERINLVLRAGEITGIAGVSGNGQATLAALLEGRIAP